MNDYTSIADLYDLYVTDTRDHAFWTRRAEEAPGPILELTAGTGRATVALRAGSERPVVALDSSHAMLRRLAARLSQSNPPVRSVCGDLADLPFPAGALALVVRFTLPDAGALRAMAEAASLRVREVYGDYDESAFTAESSAFILAALEPAHT